MMTRRDYIKTAEILNDYLNDKILDDVELIERFCEMFKADNPNFDEEIFSNAVTK
jgi:hypothetical protein